MSDLSSGIIYRHIEKLKELKTSRFRSRIRARSVEAEHRDTVPIPGWNSGRKGIMDIGGAGSLALKSDDEYI